MCQDVIYNMDALEGLRRLPDESVHCCVTSPPYYALRDYGVEGQIGRESTPVEYIVRLTDVFSEVRRVLRSDGTLWLNIADTFAGKCDPGSAVTSEYLSGRTEQVSALSRMMGGYKAKDMLGIPWMLAFSLRAGGWYLRSDIIWRKRNTMPESCKDRPTRCYEHIFLLSKSRMYYYNAGAIAEPMALSSIERYKHGRGRGKYAERVPGQGNIQGLNQVRTGSYYRERPEPTMRNKRDVWDINTASYRGSHFAAYPPKLAETCILAGCPVGGTVLDPFFGSGTTGAVARQLARHYIGIELNPEYCDLAQKRIEEAAPCTKV